MIVLKKSKPVQDDHGGLIGLGDDDHTQYSLADGTRPFTSTVSGISPTENAHLTTKQYVDDNIATVSGITNHEELNNLDYASSGHTGFVQTSHTHIESNITNLDKYTQAEVDTISGSINDDLISHTGDSTIHFTESSIDHGTISGIEDDDHTQYILADGTRGFSSTISGVAPVEDNDLATKNYVDSAQQASASGVFTIIYGPADFEETTASPGIAVAGPIVSYVFDDTVIEELHSSFVVSENWKQNANITPKINWMNDEAQTGTKIARWCIKYHTYNDTELYSSKTYTDVAVMSTLPSGCVAGYFKSSTFPYLEYNDANAPFTNGTTISFILQRDLEGGGAGGYTPPDGDSVNFTFVGGYAPPEPDEVDFIFIYGDSLVGDAGLITLIFSHETEGLT